MAEVKYKVKLGSVGRITPMNSVVRLIIIRAFVLGVLLIPTVVCAAPDWSRHFKNEWKTTYFIFHYGDEVTQAKEIARFSDGFIRFVDKEFFTAKFQYPIHVYILKDRSTFKSFLVNEAGVKDPPNWGIYLSQISSFVTYEGSGFGTFAHEIMHPLVRANLPHVPLWAEEGIPSFFEKCFGYWEGNDLVLHLGYQNPWRISELGEGAENLNLEQIVKGQDEDGTSEKRMVAVFLYSHGKLKKYIDLVKRNQKNGYSTFLEAAFELKMPGIKPLWTEYLRDVHKNRSRIHDIPASQVLETRESFKMFMIIKGLKEDTNRANTGDGN